MQVPVRNKTLYRPGATVMEGRDKPVYLGLRSLGSLKGQRRAASESRDGGGHSEAGSGPCWATSNSLSGKC